MGHKPTWKIWLSAPTRRNLRRYARFSRMRALNCIDGFTRTAFHISVHCYGSAVARILPVDAGLKSVGDSPGQHGLPEAHPSGLAGFRAEYDSCPHQIGGILVIRIHFLCAAFLVLAFASSLFAQDTK